MEIFIYIALMIGISLIITAIRNQLVFKERHRILDIVFSSKGDWRKKQKLYHKFSYDEMVYKFWKPVTSFYEKDFPIKKI